MKKISALYRPFIWKWVLVLIISIGFVAGGVMSYFRMQNAIALETAQPLSQALVAPSDGIYSHVTVASVVKVVDAKHLIVTTDTGWALYLEKEESDQSLKLHIEKRENAIPVTLSVKTKAIEAPAKDTLKTEVDGYSEASITMRSKYMLVVEENEFVATRTSTFLYKTLLILSGLSLALLAYLVLATVIGVKRTPEALRKEFEEYLDTKQAMRVGKRGLYFTPNGIIRFALVYQYYVYEDMLWIYSSPTGSKPNYALCFGNRHGKTKKIINNLSKEDIQMALNTLAERMPSALFGANSENENLFMQMTENKES